MTSNPQAEKFALVIPTLNEAGNIPTLFQRVQAALAPVNIDYELIVVDDDSRDGTADVVQAYGARDPRIRLLARKGERGLAGAVIHGWKHTDANWLGVIDASVDSRSTPWLEFLAEGRMTGFTGCNLLNGGWKSEGGQVRNVTRPLVPVGRLGNRVSNRRLVIIELVHHHRQVRGGVRRPARR